jgi:hypothetical protein
MKLYKFENAHKFLDTIGVPRLKKYANNVVVDKIDFTKQEKQGNIEWGEDGVYLNINGNYHRGFMYIKQPNIQKYGYPKFHLFECKAIEEQRLNGRFHNYYFWSNSPTVTLTDRATGKKIENVVLDLCYNCKKILEKKTGEYISNTNDFHNLLELNDTKIKNGDKEQETDIFNRPFNWRAISRAYREEQNYTCEECGFGGELLENNYDKRYIHVHHINPYDLTNTHRDNLKSVCILCHYYQDEHHQSNFEKIRMKRQLLNFIKKYKRKLIEIGNPYIEQFLKDFENDI